MKKILSFILSLTMLLGIFSLTAFAVPGTLELSVANVSGATGSEVEVALNVSTNPGVAWIAVTLDYDKAALELVSITNGSIIKDMDVGTNLIWSADDDSTATGTLATLKFKILTSTPGEYSVNLKARECYGMIDDVNLSITNGSITVGCSHKNTTSVPAIQPGATTPGYTAGVYCNDCKIYISGHVEIPPVGEEEEPVDSDVVFTFSDVVARPGDTINVELSVEGAVKYNSVALHQFTYDTSLLTFVGFANYEDIKEKAFLSSFDDSKGAITIALNPAEAFSGKICDLVFIINENAAHLASSTIDASSLVKLSSTNISTDVVSGEVLVSIQMLGDIDGNEGVDVDDCLALFQYSMLPDLYPVEYLYNMDFNKDGVVDIDDCLRLFQYSMLPDLYPIS